MKAKIATAVSVVGVLGAGSAAALVNTQILDSGPTESGASTAVLPPASTIQLTVPAVTDPIRVETMEVAVPTELDTTTSTSTTAVPTTIAAPAASGFLTSFNVGDAGTVTVDVVEGQLVLVSTDPSAGWTVTKAEDDSNDDSDEQENEIEVEFRSATVRVEFEAELIDGRIVPKVESEAIGGSSGGTSGVTAAPAAPTQAGSFDDDHDDDVDHDDEDDDERDDDDVDHDDEDDDEDDDHGERDDDDEDDD